MQTKLTLRVDERLVRKAKRYSIKTGKSVSKLVADYFILVNEAEKPATSELTPRVRSLLGSLKGAKVSEEAYRRHVEDKHR
jgi:hypothetical protein